MTTAREVARRVLARVGGGGAWATLALDGELARSGLDDRDRRLAAELVYGVLRHQLRLDRALGAHADLRRTPTAVLIALRVGAYQLLMLDRVPAHAAVDDAVTAVRAAGNTKLAGFANAVLRKIGRAGEPPLPEEPRARLEVEHSTPAWIVELVVDALEGADDEVPAAVAALASPAPLWIRANLARGTRDEVAAALTAEGATVEPFEGAALKVTGLGDPAASASFQRGLWTVQDLGAQRIGLLARPAAGQRILDACAGVGGKSTHLAELAPGAQIDAVDVSAQKLQLAARGAARLGHTSIRTITADLLDAKAPLAEHYDVVVLDAPCSGLGVLRRHPEAKWRMVREDVDRLAALQASLLDALAPRVAPGGLLVYSVCTFTRLEGPIQIAQFVARHPEFVADAPDHLLHTWPHLDGADAFFAVRLRRRATAAAPAPW